MTYFQLRSGWKSSKFSKLTFGMKRGVLAVPAPCLANNARTPFFSLSLEVFFFDFHEFVCILLPLHNRILFFLFAVPQTLSSIVSTTEFIMFAFSLCIGNWNWCSRLRNSNIWWKFMFAAMRSLVAHLLLRIQCAMLALHEVHIYLPFCNSHVHHQLFIYYHIAGAHAYKFP